VITPHVQTLYDIKSTQYCHVLVDVTGFHSYTNEIGAGEIHITDTNFLESRKFYNKTLRDMILDRSNDLSCDIVIVIVIQQSTTCHEKQC